MLVGAVIFHGRQYAFVTLMAALLSCVPFFLSFERRAQDSTRLVLIAVMTALCVAGRFLFAALPGFKPVTAMVVLTAMYFGGEAGFMTGALSAVLSNFYFGQGPWTPFQMFSWGMLGLIAGLLAGPLKQNRVLLCVYGALSGVLYSVLMDGWAALWSGGTFEPSRYLVMVASSLPFMVEYAVSNIIFLLVLAKPVAEKLERVKTKYGI
ncbi:MAG: ECF transporter S component [Clostridiales bacterium]|nr:ECF transporter S component [Clostridiales bacterium]